MIVKLYINCNVFFFRISIINMVEGGVGFDLVICDFCEDKLV